MIAMIRFLIAAGLFFFIDMAVVGSAYGTLACFNQAFFYALILEKKPLYQIFLGGFFALMPTFLRTGLWGADLVCMIPLALMLSFVARVAHLSLIVRAVLVLVCLYLHVLIIDILWAGMPWQPFVSLVVLSAYALVSLGMAFIAR